MTPQSDEFGQLLIDSCKVAKGMVILTLRGRDDLVEDALQNACMRAIQAYPNFRGDCAFSTWFTQIAINEARMMLRRKHMKVEHQEIEGAMVGMLSTRLNPEEIAQAREVNATLRDAITELPRCQREEVLLWAVGTPGRNSNAQKARRFNAKVSLKELMGAPF